MASAHIKQMKSAQVGRMTSMVQASIQFFMLVLDQLGRGLQVLVAHLHPFTGQTKDTLHVPSLLCLLDLNVIALHQLHVRSLEQTVLLLTERHLLSFL
jgi:hypothetical protein